MISRWAGHAEEFPLKQVDAIGKKLPELLVCADVFGRRLNASGAAEIDHHPDKGSLERVVGHVARHDPVELDHGQRKVGQVSQRAEPAPKIIEGDRDPGCLQPLQAGVNQAQRKRQAGRADFDNDPFFVDLRLLKGVEKEVWKRIQGEGLSRDVYREPEPRICSQQFELLRDHQPVEAFQQALRQAGGEELTAGNLGRGSGSKPCKRLVKLRPPVGRPHDRLEPDIPRVEIHAGRKIAKPGTDEGLRSREHQSAATGGLRLAGRCFSQPDGKIMIAPGHPGDAQRKAERAAFSKQTSLDATHHPDETRAQSLDALRRKVFDQEQESAPRQAGRQCRPGKHLRDRRRHAGKQFVDLREIQVSGGRCKGVELTGWWSRCGLSMPRNMPDRFSSGRHAPMN